MYREVYKDTDSCSGCLTLIMAIFLVSLIGYETYGKITYYQDKIKDLETRIEALEKN